jgi:membrane carboxypeptidase/penicillin-binding protein
MRIFLKLLLGLAVICAVLAVVGLYWFYLYSGDIPNFAALNTFAPASPARVTSDCAEAEVTAIPFANLGGYVLKATRAAEGDDSFFSRRIALRLFCNYKNQTQSLPRQLLELKASAQIQRRFTSEQILAIYLNGAYFGDRIFSIKDASQHYYGKGPSELDIGQAAMIAGLLKSPRMYSPELHPDRAKARRDEVISLMVYKGAITSAQGHAAIESDVK